MPLSARRVLELSRLSRNGILLCLAAETRPQWWATVRELAVISGVSPTRAKLELPELAALGFFERKGDGGKGAKGLFRVISEKDRIDPSTQRAEGSDRSFHKDRIDPSTQRAEGSDRSFSSSSSRARAPAPPDPYLKNSNRPSVQEGSGEGHARPGEISRPDLRGSDVRWICEQWSVSGTVAHVCWTRLLGFGLSRGEGREYLSAARRGSHAAFNGLEHAKRPLGATCTLERVTPWITWFRGRARPESSAARPPARPREEPRMSPDEFEAAIEFARSKLR
jgi:hypothetical protein